MSIHPDPLADFSGLPFEPLPMSPTARASVAASVPQAVDAALQASATAALPVGEDALAALVAELRNYQAELEIQNKVLDYSRAVADSASERFEALFANVPLPLLVLDAHDMVIQANAMALAAFQSPGNERLLANFMPFVSADSAQRVRQAFEDARKNRTSEVSEVVFNLGDGSHMQGDLHIACIEVTQQDGGAPLVQFMCALIDQGPLLAERRALQQRNAQLRASEQRLTSVINSSLDAIICVDNKNQRITVFNPTAVTLFQCHITSALGSPLKRFLPDAVQALALAPLATQVMLGEMTAHTATGKLLPVEVSMSFERLSDAQITTLYVRDMSERHREEAERRELEAQLRESHKMQALGTMAGGIAHDFNNIVGAILGNAALAIADCADNSRAMESLLEIEKAARRARDLVRQILTFSRNAPPVRRAVDVAEVLRDTEKLLRMTLPPAIELHSSIDAHTPALQADMAQVEQALFNLANNAVQAIGSARGLIQMRAQVRQLEQRSADRLGLPPGAFLALSVSDNGPGMSAELVQRIFEPFFTTKPVGQGTGLGLAVVHGVMRTHGGAVDVSSTPGEGSTFTLYFPLPDQAQNPAENPTENPRENPELPFTKSKDIAQENPTPIAPENPAPVHKAEHQPTHPRAAPPRLMYVDDDQALVFLVQRLLRRRGYEVSGFLDPREATAVLEADPAAWDLLVTDYNMPGYSGVEMLEAARSIRADLPVALASGYITPEIEAAARQAGALALIHKPNDVQELCATVDALLRR